MTTAKKKKQPDRKDDFESVAKRLECDMDDRRFREKLGKIARAKAGKKSTKAHV